MFEKTTCSSVGILQFLRVGIVVVGGDPLSLAELVLRKIQLRQGGHHVSDDSLQNRECE